ncbi:MAG: hypothetical protein ACE5G1_13945 [bacterium]
MKSTENMNGETFLKSTENMNLEVELIEPELSLRLDPLALQQIASAMAAKL